MTLSLNGGDLFMKHSLITILFLLILISRYFGVLEVWTKLNATFVE